MRISSALLRGALALLFFASIGLHSPRAEAKKEAKIAILFDLQDDVSKQVLPHIQEELEALLHHEFDLAWDEEVIVNGGGDVEVVEREAAALLANRDVDVILALGTLSTIAFSRTEDLKKPVIGFLGVAPELFGIQRVNGTSAKENFTYIWLKHDFTQEFSLLKELAELDEVSLILDPEFMERLSEWSPTKIALEAHFGIRFNPIAASEDLEETLSRVPETTDFIQFILPPTFDEEVLKARYAATNKAGLPTLGMTSLEVECGATVALYPTSNFKQVIRRIALNTQSALLGEDLSDVEVDLAITEQITFNIGTSEALGLNPSWDFLLSANLVGDQGARETTSLDDYIKAVLEQNISYGKALLEQQQDEIALEHAKSNLYPSLSVDATLSLIDEDRAKASMGQQPQGSLTPSLTLEQVLWSEPIWANVAIKESLMDASTFGLQTKRLDLVYDAIDTWLSLHQAMGSMKVQSESRKRIQENLQMARQRVEIGQGKRSDVLRLESELASITGDYISAATQVEKASLAARQLANMEIEGTLVPTPIDEALRQRAWVVAGQTQVLESPDDVKQWATFLLGEAVDHSTELAQLNKTKEAIGRQLDSAERSYWSPTLALQGKVSYSGVDFGEGSDIEVPPGTYQANDLDWQGGVSISLPLFEGFERAANIDDATLELLKLEKDLEEVALAIRTRLVMALLDVIDAQINYRLSQESEALAGESLGLVKDAYSRGVSSIVDLIDAQANFALAQEATNLSKYQLLRADLAAQRATGFFVIELESQDREALKARGLEFMNHDASDDE